MIVASHEVLGYEEIVGDDSLWPSPNGAIDETLTYVQDNLDKLPRTIEGLGPGSLGNLVEIRYRCTELINDINSIELLRVRSDYRAID